MESVAHATKFATRVAAAGTRPDARLAFLTPAHVCARAKSASVSFIFSSARSISSDPGGAFVQPERVGAPASFVVVPRQSPMPNSGSAAGGGNQQYVTSLPKQVLARLARSLATFATMPEEFAQAHIVARGQQAPPLDGRGALTRGRLLKILSDEVLAEWGGPDGAGADDDDEEEEEEEKDGIADLPQRKPEAKPASSTETTVTRAVGADDADSDSDSDEAVSSAAKPPPPETEDVDDDDEEEEEKEAPRDSDDSDDSDADSDSASEDYSDEYSDDEAPEDNWFGKAATEAPPPPGANPFAAADLDPAAEAAAQIAEAKKIVAERRAEAEKEAEALAASVRGVTLAAEADADAAGAPSTRAARGVAFASEDATADAGRTTKGGPDSEGATSLGLAGLVVGEREDKLDAVSVAGSDAGGSVAGSDFTLAGSVAGSVAATHGSEEPPRVDESLSNVGDYDDGASVATSRGALLEEDEDEDGEETDDADDNDEGSIDGDKENRATAATGVRRVLRARRPARAGVGAVPVAVAAAAAAAEADEAAAEAEAGEADA